MAGKTTEHLNAGTKHQSKVHIATGHIYVLTMPGIDIHTVHRHRNVRAVTVVREIEVTDSNRIQHSLEHYKSELQAIKKAAPEITRKYLSEDVSNRTYGSHKKAHQEPSPEKRVAEFKQHIIDKLAAKDFSIVELKIYNQDHTFMVNYRNGDSYYQFTCKIPPCGIMPYKCLSLQNDVIQRYFCAAFYIYEILDIGNLEAFLEDQGFSAISLEQKSPYRIIGIISYEKIDLEVKYKYIPLSEINLSDLDTDDEDEKLTISIDSTSSPAFQDYLTKLIQEGGYASRLGRVSGNNEPTPDIYGNTMDFDSMDGHAFEYYCADLLRKNGYTSVSVTSSSGDQGVDIIAYRDGVKYGIQCKRYTADIGNKAVQEIYAGKAYYNCHVGIVLTNQFFTPSAYYLPQ